MGSSEEQFGLYNNNSGKMDLDTKNLDTKNYIVMHWVTPLLDRYYGLAQLCFYENW